MVGRSPEAINIPAHPGPECGRQERGEDLAGMNFPAAGIRTLEMRWLSPGPLGTPVTGWFARFPAETESREDAYLLDPDFPGLSVKVRALGALEVKAFRGRLGILNMAGRACGRMEFWEKWSFPFRPLSQQGPDPPGWMTVAKRRRICRFSLRSGQIAAGASGRAGEPECAVELTDVGVGGEAWWSLGFEASGPEDLLRDALETAAEHVFAQALPGGVELGIDDSRSYAEWLRR